MYSAKSMFNLIMVVIVAVLLAACGSVQPRLNDIYRTEERGAPFQPPVIIVPGIVSSTLVDQQGKEIWFGSIRKLLFSNYEELALEINPQTLAPKPSKYRPGILPKSVVGKDFYGPLFKTLEKAGRYKLAKLGDPYTTPERRYYKFSYDWRYGNEVTAKKLDAFIEQIRRDYNRPNMKVDLIGHSMGGLIIRYYMRYGDQDVLADNDFPVSQAGAKKARRVILLGSPNLGSVSTLAEIIEGYKVIFGRIPTESVITLPSIYQLLPHPLNNWIVTAEGKHLKRDLFNVNLWRRFQWSVFDPKVIQRIKKRYASEAEGERRVALLQDYMHNHLERARRFVWSLSVMIEDPKYQLINFGGNCQPTPARIVVEEVDGESLVRLRPKQIKRPVKGVDYKRLMLEPGDGRVTKPSMLARDFLDPSKPRHRYSFFPQDYAFFLCEDHIRVTSNINFQDNLLNVLLEQTREDFMAAQK